jgi:uncharacterized membrane protein
VRVLAGLTVLAAALYGTLALVRFHTFRASTYDLVIFDQGMRSYSHLQLPVAIVKGVHNGFGPDFVLLGDHFSPILALLAPLYWIHDGPQTLLIAQAVLFAAAIPPLWVFARRELGTTAAYCVTGVYALSWPIAEAVAFDFHEVAFAPVLTAVMFERFQAGRRTQGVFAALALLLVKEDMGLLVAGFGLYLLTRRSDRRFGAVFVIGGLAATWLASQILIPAFGGDADYYWAYEALGKDAPEAAAHTVSHPWDAFRVLLTPPVKVRTVALLFAPLLFVSLRSPLVLAAVPLLAERMLASQFGNWWESRYHYNAFIVVVLISAGIDGARRLRDRSPRLATGWAIGALVAAVVMVPFFSLRQLADPSFSESGTRAQAAAVTQVPDGAYVEAASVFGPQLSARARVLLWDDRPRWAPWVVADVGRHTFPFPTLDAQRDRLDLLLRNGYRVVWQREGYVVLNRPGSVPDLRAQR